MEFDDVDLPLLGDRPRRLLGGCRGGLFEAGGDRLLPPPTRLGLPPRGKRRGFNSTELEGEGVRCLTTSAVSWLFEWTAGPRGPALPFSLPGVNRPALGACWSCS